MLSVEHVTKRYGKFTALENVNLAFEPGVYGLLAPNGAGKTTLIKLLATLLFPTEGKILWDGEDIHVLGAKYRGLLGYLPQDFGFYPSYTARQFLRYAAALQCLPKREAEQRISELLGLVGLADAADKKLKTFSAGLDPRERVRFRNLIHALAADRIVILSTHIVSDIETIAGQIVMFKDHKLYCCDRPAKICTQWKGKVWQMPAEAQLDHDQFILSEGQSEDGPVLRVLSESPPAGAISVTPSLEDAFLAIYREEGRG